MKDFRNANTVSPRETVENMMCVTFDQYSNIFMHIEINVI